jgi:hypothetical protein
MTTTTMRAFTGTRVSGALPVAWPTPLAQKPRVAPFVHLIVDNSKGTSARRYRHT